MRSFHYDDKVIAPQQFTVRIFKLCKKQIIDTFSMCMFYSFRCIVILQNVTDLVFVWVCPNLSFILHLSMTQIQNIFWRWCRKWFKCVIVLPKGLWGIGPIWHKISKLHILGGLFVCQRIIYHHLNLNWDSFHQKESCLSVDFIEKCFALQCPYILLLTCATEKHKFNLINGEHSIFSFKWHTSDVICP